MHKLKYKQLLHLTNGKVSDKELKEYLSDTMTYYARRYYGRDQKVQIHNGGQ